MGAVKPLPSAGSIYVDARNGDRALRISWHDDAGLVVLSLWRENVCAGTFRLPVDEVPELIEMLRGGLDRAYVARRAAAERLAPAPPYEPPADPGQHPGRHPRLRELPPLPDAG